MGFDFGAEATLSLELDDFPFDFVGSDELDDSDKLSASLSFSAFPSDFNDSAEVFEPDSLSDPD